MNTDRGTAAAHARNLLLFLLVIILSSRQLFKISLEQEQDQDEEEEGGSWCSQFSLRKYVIGQTAIFFLIPIKDVLLSYSSSRYLLLGGNACEIERKLLTDDEKLDWVRGLNFDG